MIKKLLIANRGEIACRIIRTCRDMGLGAVAVYSDADAKAKHVREADKAVHIGASPAAESYLLGDKIIAAAKETGCDAIHPGYGFLSENADFAEAVIKAGLIWVGPKPETTRQMGLKDAAKRIAREAGVPVLPGYEGEAQDVKSLTTEAKTVGYPLLIKAVAGGGGRGIREVTKASELKAQLESAVREAESSFGDGRVLLEKLVIKPRHIEVQVFGDAHGNIVHMFERDCSLQRRRQKVIEEAPAPGMDDKIRKVMTDAAVKLAKAVSYEGAGTVEFIVDGDKPLSPTNFWFLEMNTRLQVEHPVTEMITGLDLVEWQLRVASGEKLPAKQKDIKLNGHAIEARICAEDPSQDFRPGAGRIEVLDCVELSGGRLDFGFEEGDRVPSDYDSMIGKLIIHDEDRAEACRILEDCLHGFVLHGVPANTGFLMRCLGDEAFKAGTHHVNLIADTGKALTSMPPEHELAGLIAVAEHLLETVGDDAPWNNRDTWRMNSWSAEGVRLQVGETVGLMDPWAWELPDDTPDALIAELSPRRFGVTVAGDNFIVSIPDYDSDAEALAGGDNVFAPMPGKILSVDVKVGTKVSMGDTVAVMEAMKMEHSLTAPRDGVVAEVGVKIGAQVADGALIAGLEAEA